MIPSWLSALSINGTKRGCIMGSSFSNLTALGICLTVCFSAAALSQDRRAVAGYEKAYDELSRMEVSPPIQSDEPFLPNWLVKAPGEGKIKITFGPGDSGIGVLMHRSELLVQVKPNASVGQFNALKKEFGLS